MRLLVVIVALLAALLPGRSGLAQSVPGSFVPFDDAYFFHDPGFVLPDNLGYAIVGGGQNIIIDRNGDGRINSQNQSFPIDPAFVIPAEARGAFNYFLSPSRQYLLVRGLTTPSGCTTGLRIQLYRVPASGNILELVHDACLPGGMNNGNGKWYDSGLCLRDFVSGQCTTPSDFDLGTNQMRLFVALTNNGGSPQLIWFDLTDPGPPFNDGRAASNFAGPSAAFGSMTVARGGNFAFVQSNINNGFGTSDFDVIDICPSSQNFGEVVLGGPSLHGVNDPLTATIDQITGAGPHIQPLLNGIDLGSGVTRPECPSIPPPPPTGACCVAGVCAGPVTRAVCDGMSGTWSEGIGCSPNPCPQPAPLLTVSGAGPTIANLAGPIVYTLTYSNTGSAPASGVIVSANLPGGTSFISAPGGVFAGNAVTWNVGNLPAMSSPQTLTLTLRAPCFGNSVTLNSYNITGTGTPTFGGSPQVTTVLAPAVLDPVSITVASVPARVPLQGGDVVTHTITLANASTQERQNLTIQSIQAGSSSVIGQVISAGAGTVTMQGTTSASWSGSLMPLQTIDIVFTTRVQDCINQFDTQTQLNNGQFISVRDSCFAQLGQAIAPGPFDLIKPIAVSLAAVNVTPGQIGPASRGGVFGDGTSYQPVRDGATAVFEVTLTNQIGTNVPNATFSLQLPDGLTVTATPLVAPIPAGAAFDAGTRTISFNGLVPASGQVTIRFEATLVSAGECSLNVDGLAGAGACQNAEANLVMLFVPALPSQTYLLGAYGFRGLFTFTPGVDSATTNLLCLVGEIYGGIDRAPNGDVLVVGLPNFIFNPETLHFEFIDQQLEAAGIHLPTDGAIDPLDGTLLLSGGSPQLRRLDLATGVATTIVNESALGGGGDVQVDADGSVVLATNQGGVRRVDARTGPFPLPVGGTTLIPLPPVDYSDVPLGTIQGSPSTVKLAKTPNGDYAVVLQSFYRAGTLFHIVYALFDIERATSAATLVHRAIAASSFTQQGNPSVPPAALNPVFLEDLNSDAVARTSDRFFITPTGSQNTSLIVMDTSVSPPTIAGSFNEAPYSVGDMVVVEISTTPPCRADFNGDGLVFPDDLSEFITCFFLQVQFPGFCPRADFNGDGLAFPDDLSEFITTFFLTVAAGGC